MTIPALPPKRPIPAPAGVSAPTTPAATATAKAKPAPKPAAKPAPKAKVPTKAVAKPAPKAAPKGPKPATENVVPKVPAVKAKGWGEEAITLACLIYDLKQAAVTFPGEGMEIRNVNERLRVYLHGKGVEKCLKVYTLLADLKAIVKVAKTVPTELLPAKWVKAIERADAWIAKQAAAK